MDDKRRVFRELSNVDLNRRAATPARGNRSPPVSSRVSQNFAPYASRTNARGDRSPTTSPNSPPSNRRYYAQRNRNVDYGRFPNNPVSRPGTLSSRGNARRPVPDPRPATSPPVRAQTRSPKLPTRNDPTRRTQTTGSNGTNGRNGNNGRQIPNIKPRVEGKSHNTGQEPSMESTVSIGNARNEAFERNRQRRRYLEALKQDTPTASIVEAHQLDEVIGTVIYGQAIAEPPSPNSIVEQDPSDMIIAVRPQQQPLTSVYSLTFDGIGYRDSGLATTGPISVELPAIKDSDDESLTSDNDEMVFHVNPDFLRVNNFFPTLASASFDFTRPMDITFPEASSGALTSMSWNNREQFKLQSYQGQSPASNQLLLVAKNLLENANGPILIEKSAVHIASSGCPFIRFKLVKRKVEVIRDDERFEVIDEADESRIYEMNESVDEGVENYEDTPNLEQDDYDEYEDNEEPLTSEGLLKEARQHGTPHPIMEQRLAQFYNELGDYFIDPEDDNQSMYSVPEYDLSEGTDIEFPLRPPGGANRAWSMKFRSKFHRHSSSPNKNKNFIDDVPNIDTIFPHGTIGGHENCSRNAMEIDTAFRKTIDELAQSRRKRQRFRSAFKKVYNRIVHHQAVMAV